MLAYFFDSSGLVKRFASETGTAWVVGLISADKELNNAATVERLTVDNQNNH